MKKNNIIRIVSLGRNWKKNTELNKELQDHNFIQMIPSLTKTYDSLTQIMTSKLRRWKPTYGRVINQWNIFVEY